MGELIKFTHKGDFSNTLKFFNKLLDREYLNVLEKYGKMGVEALKSATPRDTGKTAESWGYSITSGSKNTTIGWYNTNVNDGCRIAVILQYGHATRSGVYIEGTDYINPVVKPIFEQIANDAWKEVMAL